MIVKRPWFECFTPYSGTFILISIYLASSRRRTFPHSLFSRNPVLLLARQVAPLRSRKRNEGHFNILFAAIWQLGRATLSRFDLFFLPLALAVGVGVNNPFISVSREVGVTVFLSTGFENPNFNETHLIGQINIFMLLSSHYEEEMIAGREACSPTQLGHEKVPLRSFIHSFIPPSGGHKWRACLGSLSEFYAVIVRRSLWPPSLVVGHGKCVLTAFSLYMVWIYLFRIHFRIHFPWPAVSVGGHKQWCIITV